MVSKMFVVKKEKEKTLSLPAKEIDPRKIKAASSELAQRILGSISTKAKYPKEIAKELGVHEQKVYYHIKNLESAGIINIARKENRQGAVANFYTLTKPALVIRFSDFQQAEKISLLKEEHKEFFDPFIQNGQLNAKMIVGSPDPHGPDKARSRDGYYGIDFALFLGCFLNYVPKLNVKLDTETREEDLKDNLIVIGGPITNKITARFNEHLPIFFDSKKGMNIHSKISKNIYTSDETGIIVKIKNPFADGKYVLVIAGKRFSGTRAAIIAFLKGFKEIVNGNIIKKSTIAKVVEGVDLDSDGVVDAVEFRE